MRQKIELVMIAVGTMICANCHASQILNVPPPAGVVTGDAINGQASAEAAFATAFTDFSGAVDGSDALIEDGGWLTDEFQYGDYGNGYYPNVDARRTTAAGGFVESGDTPLQGLLNARSELLVNLVSLQKYETGSGTAKVGEAYAIVGYAEMLMAEGYCAGVTLSQIVAGGGVIYGTPLTTDSLLGTAQAHFDSALAHANGNDTVTALASTGLGRTLLDRGQYTAAAAAVGQVPTPFVYNIIGAVTGSYNQYYQPNLYEYSLVANFEGCADFNVSNQEGTNGLNFISAHDPRLVLDSTLAETCDGLYGGLSDSVFYFPSKFNNPAAYIPLATGVEARLMEAEAALQTDPTTWAADLNALRADATDTHVTFSNLNVAIPADSTTGAAAPAQVDFMFRERAFWLFGTGTRLGDLRRLIRQYDRSAETVFPTGPYLAGNNPIFNSGFPSPITTYGTDVNLTLPTPLSGVTTANPYYKGCITSTGTA